MKLAAHPHFVTRRAFLAASLLLGAATTARSGEERLARRRPEDLGRNLTSPNIVRATQKALNAQGHDAGVADGLMGPNTRRAIRSFQAAEEMEQTGQIDRDLLQKLGLIAR